MEYIDRPAGYPAALHWPPSYPTAGAYERALKSSPLTPKERQTISAAVDTIAAAEAEIASASPAGVKAALDKLVTRGRAGDDSVAVSDVRAAAERLEAAKIAEGAVRDLLQPKIAAAQHSVDPIALRLLDAAETAMKAIAGEVAVLTRSIAELTGDNLDEEFWNLRFTNTLPAFEAARKSIAGGGALAFLRHQLGVAEAEPPKPAPPDRPPATE